MIQLPITSNANKPFCASVNPFHPTRSTEAPRVLLGLLKMVWSLAPEKWVIPSIWPQLQAPASLAGGFDGFLFSLRGIC